MDKKKQSGQSNDPFGPGASSEPGATPAIDEFFEQLKQGLYKPKSRQAAAALAAVQRLQPEMDAEDMSTVAETQEGRACLSCGSKNAPQNLFCAKCGVPLQDTAAISPEPFQRPTAEPPSEGLASKPIVPAAGEHHYHHHYHHHYFASSDGAALGPAQDTRGASSAAAARDAVRVRAPLIGGAPMSRAEAAVRKMTQDWAFACNTKHLDDLAGLYVSDGILLRPNVPPIRGTAAIREFFFTALDSGLGDVEMESVRVEIVGETAFEAGRCKMLVPSASGKRREERGKYLIVAARLDGEWKILADCFSSDLSLAAGGEAVPAKSAAHPPARNS